MGRPRAFDDENWALLLDCLRMDLSLIQCSSICHVAPLTVEREIRARMGKTFGDFREECAEGGIRLKLYQKGIDLALRKDNVLMLIFCLKNKLGWKDTVDVMNRHSGLGDIQIQWQDEADQRPVEEPKLVEEKK